MKRNHLAADFGDARKGWAIGFITHLKQVPVTTQFGSLIILIYLAVAVFAPFIARFGEAEVVGSAYQAMGPEFLLGTDQIGRDILSRLIYGARNTIGIAVLTTVISFSIGTVLGILVAIYRGWLDLFLAPVMDALMSIPTLIFSLMLLAVFGKSVVSLVLILALLDSTRVFRLARAAAMSVVVTDYVEAARLRGEGLRWLVVKEILPNISTILVAEFGVRFCFVFLTISALSFLGVGIQPPTADWGSMVAESKTLIIYGNPTPLLAAGAIALLTVAVNFVVDWFLHKASGLRDEV